VGVFNVRCEPVRIVSEVTPGRGNPSILEGFSVGDRYPHQAAKLVCSYQRVSGHIWQVGWYREESSSLIWDGGFLFFLDIDFLGKGQHIQVGCCSMLIKEVFYGGKQNERF